MLRVLSPLTALQRRPLGFAADAPSSNRTGDRRRRSKTLGAVGIALTLHAILLVMVLSWKAPALMSGLAAEQVSLVSVPGLVTAPMAKPAPKPQLQPPQVSTAPSNSIPPPDEAGASIRQTVRFDPPKDVVSVVVDILLGGSPPASAVATGAPAAAIAPAALGAPVGGKACQILEALQSTLQTSEPVRRALALIPPRARSVANAVMLWDGRWQDETALGGPAAVAPVEQAVLQTISAAPPGCQSELVRGPRLITIGDTRNTTVLAFGSGEWRWGDLLAAAPVGVSAPRS